MIIYALEKLEHLLIMKPFVIETDHLDNVRLATVLMASSARCTRWRHYHPALSGDKKHAGYLSRHTTINASAAIDETIEEPARTTINTGVFTNMIVIKACTIMKRRLRRTLSMRYYQDCVTYRHL